MKTIIVNSKKWGIKEILVDDEDFELVSKHRWHVDKSKREFYAKTNIPKHGGGYRSIKMHRLIMGIANPSIHVDHIKHNGLDNRRCNLRLCDNAQGVANRFGNSNSSSIYKGVTKSKNRWKSQARKNKILYYLGLYKTEEEAARAYDKKAIELFGEFACLNFPTP